MKRNVGWMEEKLKERWWEARGDRKKNDGGIEFLRKLSKGMKTVTLLYI